MEWHFRFVLIFLIRYIRSKDRAEKRKKRSGEEECIIQTSTPVRVTPIFCSKRQKLDVTKGVTTCIICNKNQINYQTVCENLSAKKFFKACKFFDDDRFRKCIYLKTPNDVYAADIHYHKACMNGYLLKFKLEVETILNGDTPEGEYEIIQIFKEVISKVHLKNKATHLSTIRDQMNESIEKNVNFVSN